LAAEPTTVVLDGDSVVEVHGAAEAIETKSPKKPARARRQTPTKHLQKGRESY
jgi:hypothetical protein